MATPNIKRITIGLFCSLNYRQTSFLILFYSKMPTKRISIFHPKSWLSSLEKSYMATPNIKLFTTGLSGLFSCLNYRQTSFFILSIITQKRPTKTNSFFDLKSSLTPMKNPIRRCKTSVLYEQTVHSPLFFFNIVRIERLLVHADNFFSQLVSRWLPVTQSTRSGRSQGKKIRELLRVY